MNGKGRFWYNYAGGNISAGSNVEHTAIDNYDSLGRPLVQRQLFKLNGTWGPTYQVSRSYNLAGGVTTQTYPSGRMVTYNYDQAGRLGDKDASNLAFSGNLGDGVNRTYSRGILYSPFGGVAKEQFGTDTALYNKSFYNGQLAEIRVSTSYTGPTDTTWNRGAIINHYSNQCWGMCGGEQSTQAMTDNNGNLRKQDVYIPHNDQVSSYTNWWQGYEYDALNRLYKVGENTGSQLVWQQEYVIDRYGNRTIHQTNTWGTGINKRNFTVDPSLTNRLLVPSGQTGSMQYDFAGNLINDTYSDEYNPGGARTYDAENRITVAWNGSYQNIYTYDAGGKRMRRNLSSVITWHVYGFDGELLAEYAANGSPTAPQKEYCYRNGQLLIVASSGGTSVSSATWSTLTNGIDLGGGSVRKTSPDSADWWDCTATAQQQIVGSGYFEATPVSAGKQAIGIFGNDGSERMIYIGVGSWVGIWEDGEGVSATSGYPTSPGIHQAGDRYRIEVEGSTVTYVRYRAGERSVMYVSTAVAPAQPLTLKLGMAYQNADALISSNTVS